MDDDTATDPAWGRASKLLILGTICLVVGVQLSIAMLFKPWASCDYDDSSAGCALTPLEIPFLILGLG